MAEAGVTGATKPKRHSAFVQIIFRKFGEAFDLGGKAIVGLAGFGSMFKVHRFADVDWPHLLTGLLVGGAFLAFGIYSASEGGGDLKMPDAIFAVIVAVGGLGAVMGIGVLLVVSRIEANERRRPAGTHPAE